MARPLPSALTDRAVHVAVLWQTVQHIRHRLGNIHHRPVAATRRTIIQMLAYIRGTVAQQHPLRRRLLHVLGLGTAQRRVPLHLPLVLEEDLIRLVHQVLHTDDSPQTRHHVVLRDQRQHHQRLHHQLPVLGLRNRIQRRLHLQRKLQLPGGHLLRQALRQDAALNRQSLTLKRSNNHQPH